MNMKLAMWETWQDKVKLALPMFCQHPLYVSQDMPQEKFEQVADYVAQYPEQLLGKTFWEEYGARVVDTRACGKVTRMWLDAVCEWHFLRQHLSLSNLHILDIGAGYGRFACHVEDWVGNYICTDAVPISRFICEYVIHKHCRLHTDVKVLAPEQIEATLLPGQIGLAINIHSWSECSIESIQEWLELIKRLQIPNLFVVPHDDHYYPHGPGGSFRPLIEKDFDLVAEEKLGMCDSPHSLWERKP